MLETWAFMEVLNRLGTWEIRKWNYFLLELSWDGDIFLIIWILRHQILANIVEQLQLVRTGEAVTQQSNCDSFYIRSWAETGEELCWWCLEIRKYCCNEDRLIPTQIWANHHPITRDYSPHLTTITNFKAENVLPLNTMKEHQSLWCGRMSLLVFRLNLSH